MPQINSKDLVNKWNFLQKDNNISKRFFINIVLKLQNLHELLTKNNFSFKIFDITFKIDLNQELLVIFLSFLLN